METGTQRNFRGEARVVVQVDDDGTVWWTALTVDGEHWDTPKRWREWMTGVKEKN